MNVNAVKPWERRAIFFILAAATALRVYKLDSPLWFDEMATVINYVRAPFAQVIADYSSFNNHLFYSIQAKLSVLAFGESPWSLRFPALLFGVGSIWLVWRIARRYCDPKVALLSAALLAVSYHHIWFTQNARGYTELMFWSLAALAAFEANRQSGDWRRWLLFALCLACAMYTHLTAAFFVAALGLTWIATLAARRFPRLLPSALAAPAGAAQWTPLFGFALGGAITILLCLPAISQMATLIGAVDDTVDIDVMAEYRNPLWSVAEGFRTIIGGSALMAVAAPVATVVMIVGGVSLWKRAPAFVLVAILQIPVTLIALSIVSMRVWPRFFFNEFAFASVFIAEGAFVLASFIAPWMERRGVLKASSGSLFLAGAAAMLAASMTMALRNYTMPKQNFEAPLRMLEAQGAEPVSVGVVGWAYVPYLNFYEKDWKRLYAASDIAALKPTDGHIWVVSAFPARTSRANADIWAVLQRDFEVAGAWPGSLGDGRVMLFRSKDQLSETSVR
ncbi:MAG: glycosyltransferase family 39 protein [Parvularculaceae bacterium]|nr:glycosyltransferase family 39 protein [Parvularculaceae bacterium]